MATKPNRMTRAVGNLANRMRGLFRWTVATSVDSTDVPALIEVEDRGNRELVAPFGFKATPKAKDANGEPFYLTAGQGSDAIALSFVDFRYEPTDVAAGESRMYNATGQKLDCKSTGFVANATIDATGFKAGGTAGKTGTLVIVDTGPTGALGQVTLNIKGGIITGVACTPPTGGTITWTGD